MTIHFAPLESFWVDVALQNPLDAKVTFTDLSLVVEARDKDTLWISEYVTVERVKEVVLSAKATRVVSPPQTCHFLSLFFPFDPGFSRTASVAGSFVDHAQRHLQFPWSPSY